MATKKHKPGNKPPPPPPTTTPAGHPTTTAGSTPVGIGRFLLAWFALIMLLIIIARTKIGNKILYYAFAGTILFLVVSHPGDITYILGDQGDINPNG